MGTSGSRIADFVTTHNRLVVAVMLVLSIGVVAGVTADTGSTDGGSIDIGETEVSQAAEYISDSYGNESETTRRYVYVRSDDGSALSRATLISAIEHQQAVLENESVAGSLATDGVYGPPNVVATGLADGPDPDLDEQRAALEGATDTEVRQVVNETFTGQEATRTFLPIGYEPGSPNVEGMRFSFAFEDTDGNGTAVPPAVERALSESGGDYERVDFFTVGSQSWSQLNRLYLTDTLWLVLPPILLVMLLTLAVVYRDVVDIALGMVGTLVALLWTFGLMGWFGLFNQQVALVAPVLVVGISIDFGLHVFMRYRERGGAENGIRDSIRYSTTSVAFAFLLVTITAAIGFMPNVTSPVSVIRALGISITLGIVSSLLIFVTLVPALKVSVEGLLQRVGFERRNAPLGDGTYLRRGLLTSVTVARRAAPVVLVLVVVASAFGALSFTELDQETYQHIDFEVEEWKTDLPGPMAFDAFESESAREIQFQQRFQPDNQGAGPSQSFAYTQFLIRGDVTDPAVVDAIRSAEDDADEASDDVVLRQGGSVELVTPVSLMQAVTARSPAFAETYENADTDGDGVPDRNLVDVYDQFYEVAPEQASRVIERTDDGEYRSARLFVPTRPSASIDRAETMNGIADSMEEPSGMTVTAVGAGTVTDTRITKLTNSIVRTMLLALGAIAVLLVVVYRIAYDSASLGLVTAAPVVFALALVFGGMYLAGIPLTFETSLLVSITIGLGVDYNIHVSSRVAEELERGADIWTALSNTVTVTGGALLGSAVTSGGAFALMVIAPDGRLQSFGAIVAFALAVSFLLSVFVLPSLLLLWAHGMDEYGVRSVTRAD